VNRAPWQVAAAGLLALALAGARRPEEAPGHAEAPAEAWRGFPVFVWFHGGPRAGPAPFAVLRRHGLGGCNVEGSASSEPARAAGMDFYVDHVAGKGDLFLRPEVFDEDRRRLREDLLGCRPRRPRCFNDSEVMARLRRLVAENVARHAGNSPLAWVLDDELSVTRGVNPMDYCFGEECLRGLRDFLRAGYGSIERLNAEWGSAWRGFDEIVPPTTEEARRANAGRPLEEVNFAAWNAHREFMRRSFARAIGQLVADVAAAGGTGPAGFTGGQFPSAFGGFEGEELFRACSLVEVYEAGVAPELVRGLLPPGGKLISTLFVPEGEAARAEWTPWEVVARAARGDDGAVIWASGALFTPDGGDLNATGLAIASAVRRADGLRRLLAEARAVPVAAPVALYGNAESLRAAWMLDSWSDGRTWPNRLTSHEAAHSSSATSREGWVAALQAACVPFRFVGPRELATGTLPGEGVRCIVLHEALALSEAEVGALEGFVRAGGRLIADAHVALFDERLRGRDSLALTRLFAVTRAAGATLDRLAEGFGPRRGAGDPGEADGLRPDAATRSTSLGTERALGGGLTLHANLRFAGSKGRAPSFGRSIAPRLAEWLAARDVIRPGPRLPCDVADRLRLHRWETGDGARTGAERAELLAVVAIAPARGPVATTIDFAAPVEIEWIEPRRQERAVEVSRVAIEVDEQHPVVLRWRAVR